MPEKLHETDISGDCIACYEETKWKVECCKASICEDCYLKWLETKRQCMHCREDQCEFERWVEKYRKESTTEYTYDFVPPGYIVIYADPIDREQNSRMSSVNGDERAESDGYSTDIDNRSTINTNSLQYVTFSLVAPVVYPMYMVIDDNTQHQQTMSEYTINQDTISESSDSNTSDESD